MNNPNDAVPAEGIVPEVEKNLDDLFVVAKFEEVEAERTAYSNYSYWGSTIKTFFKRPSSLFAVLLMAFVVIFAYIQPYLPGQQRADYTEYRTQYDMWKSPPSAKHWFGTDEIGRDLWARVWNGTRISISLAFLVAVTEVALGIVIGALWGYIRQLDRFMTELYNTIANIPSTIILILLTYILQPGYWTMYLAMSLTGWLSMARFIRNQVLIIRDREYNLASKCLGTPTRRMITKNLIPHLVSVIIMRLALSIPAVIGSESMLTYLGIGLPLEIPSLGVLLNAGRDFFTFKPHLMLFPALLISMITVSFYVAGNAFADASDPRNHS